MARCAINLNCRRAGRSLRRLRFESLEDRRLLTTFTVTNLNDAVVTGPGSAPGTLRQAIYDANASSDADLIQFAANLSGSISLFVIGDTDPSVGLSELLIDSPITIRGNANGITIARAATATDRRLIRVTGNGDLTLESITLSGGTARGATGSPAQNGGAGLGGALYNDGTLLIVSSTLLGNIAAGGSAGAGTDAGAGLGGAIYNNEGSVSIRNSTLSNNSVVNGGGASNIVHSYGGAVYSKNGLLKIYNSTVTNNSAYSGRELYIIGIGAGHTGYCPTTVLLAA